MTATIAPVRESATLADAATTALSHLGEPGRERRDVVAVTNALLAVAAALGELRDQADDQAAMIAGRIGEVAEAIDNLASLTDPPRQRRPGRRLRAVLARAARRGERAS